MTFPVHIDAHVHLWDMARNDDILILEQEPQLAPMGQAEALKSHLGRNGVAGAIVVQSAPSKAHSDWLRRTARDIDGIVGIVGWIDPQGQHFESHLTELINDPLVCGVRLMLNRMQRPRDILEQTAIDNLAILMDAGLTIECLAPPPLLPCVAALANALPDARFVLDHCGLPPADHLGLADWEANLLDVSRHGNVSTKLSGLIEPFGAAARLEPVQMRALTAIELFGPDRMMAASNFPVVSLGGGTDLWADMLQSVLQKAGLSNEERHQVAQGAALSAYPRALFGHNTEVHHV